MASTYTAAITSGTISCGGITGDVLSGSITLSKEEIAVTVQTGETIAWEVQVPGGKCWAEMDINFAFTGTIPFTPDALSSFTFNLGSGHSVTGSCMIHKATMNKSESGVLQGSASGKSSGEVTWS